MRTIFLAHLNFWKNKRLAISAVVALVFFAFSLITNYWAGVYTEEVKSNAVTDAILNNIPAYNVSLIFVYGTIFLTLLICAILLKNPQRLPFGAKAVALLIVIRSVFVSLTHIGPFPTQIPLILNYTMSKLLFGSDLFFSGHTAVPFMMALIFWQNKKLRYLFLCLSLFFGASVLLGHLHYSIDVFAAFFITYSVFALAKKIFAADYAALLAADAR